MSLAVSTLMLLFAKTKDGMDKKEGWICVLLYVAYTAYLFIR